MNTTTIALVGGGLVLVCVGVACVWWMMQQQNNNKAQEQDEEQYPEPPVTEPEPSGVGSGRSVYPSQTATMSPMLTSRPVTLEWTLAPGTPAPLPPPPAPPVVPVPPPPPVTDPAYQAWYAQHYQAWYQQQYGQYGQQAPLVPLPVVSTFGATPPAGKVWFNAEEMHHYFKHQCACPVPAASNGGHTHLKAMNTTRDQAVCCKPPAAGSGATAFQQCAGFKKVPTMGWMADATVTGTSWPPMLYTRDAKCTGWGGGKKGGWGGRKGGKKGGKKGRHKTNKRKSGTIAAVPTPPPPGTVALG